MTERTGVLDTSYTFLALLLSAVILTSAKPVWAKDEGTSRPPVIDVFIPSENIDEMRAPEADAKLVREQGSSQNEKLVIDVAGKRYALERPELTPEEALLYKNMSDSDKELFLRHRTIYLTKAAQLFSTAFMSNMFGTASLTAGKIRWAWDHTKDITKGLFYNPPHFTDREYRDIIPDNDWAEQNKPVEPIDEKALQTFKERKFEVVQRALMNLDKHFWSRPYLIANNNEVGFFASVGVTLFGGVDVKYKGNKINKGLGGSFEIGIFIGWNRTDASAVLQIFRLTEKFRGTMTAVSGNAALVPKWGIMFANVQKGMERAYESGAVQYPPAPPGVSAYYLSSPRRFAIGANPPFGVIPWPLDVVLVYSMDYVMKPMLRIGFRFEALKQFIHVDTGSQGEFRSMARSSVQRVKDLVRAQFTGRSMCVSIHGL